jgi:hypothetical protein
MEVEKRNEKKKEKEVIYHKEKCIQITNNVFNPQGATKRMN